MDGRDLLKEVCDNWNSNMRVVDIINKLTKLKRKFCQKKKRHENCAELIGLIKWLKQIFKLNCLINFIYKSSELYISEIHNKIEWVV